LKTASENRPFCLIAGGETTVTLNGSGRGGRNQELALAAVNELAGLPNVMLVSLATDGEDGSTDASGAVVTGETFLKGQQAGLSPHTFLANNDSYSYFSTLEDSLKPGLSGTNVNDLTLLFGF
jgi:hydroxypyruvate reductase